MAKKRRRIKKRQSSRTSPPRENGGASALPPRSQRPRSRRWIGVVGLCVLAGVLLGWWSRSRQTQHSLTRAEVGAPNRTVRNRATPEQPIAHDNQPSAPDQTPDQQVPPEKPDHAESDHAKNEETPEDSPEDSPLPNSFLESFGAPENATAANDIVKSNEALEKSFHELVASMEERDQLQTHMFTAMTANDRARMAQLRSSGRALTERLNHQLSSLEGELKSARQSRPDDPLVQWLTGELLMHVGGEPLEMLPYFERALKGGLVRARLVASLARVQFEANQFAAAYQSALKAFTLGEPDKYLWETYDRVARGNEQFDQLTERLDAAFPDPQKRPAWEATLHERAIRLTKLWKRESNFREAARQKDDLPRVRLTIEHRRFVRDAEGKIGSQIEVTGQGEVMLELLEDQAPQTVANFLSLVEQGFYNDTLFLVAESARYVRVGDPKTRNDDPHDDGEGGPGYVIPDEFQRPDARDHFRGSLSMVNTGPHTAGSQFFITLAPNESFNHHFTVFGRVIQGQEDIDGITPGRTTMNIGHFGRIVPGDKLVKAEVIRKRNHAYTATKE